MEPEPASLSGTEPPRGLRLWLMTVRAESLTVAAMPVAVGGAMSWAHHGVFHFWLWLGCLLGAVLLLAGTNLWNDVYDQERGNDPIMPGAPLRVLTQGWVKVETVRRAALCVFAALVVLGAVLAWVGGWPILVLGGLSLLVGWAYSGGSKPVEFTPWSELVVLLFLGVAAVGGTVWMQTHTLPAYIWPLGIAVGLPTCGIMLINNVRDQDIDYRVGRRTLAMHLGERGAKIAYGGMMLVPFLLLVPPVVPGGGWVAVLAVPEAIRLVRAFGRGNEGRDLNQILGMTGRFQAILSGLVIVGALAL